MASPHKALEMLLTYYYDLKQEWEDYDDEARIGNELELRINEAYTKITLLVNAFNQSKKDMLEKCRK